MAFCEFRFLVFFLTVFAVYWVLRRNVWRKCWLLASSYFFYAAWDWRFLSLILFSTVLDYAVGRALTRTSSTGIRRGLLVISLVANLGLLAFFKYFGFFVESAQQLMQLMGLPLNTQTLNIILPVGISFYTFQTLSYTIDIYRGKIEPARCLIDFALYVSFFPQLVAGPIVRARSFLPQLDRKRAWQWSRVHAGLQMIIIGLFKKIAIADRMAGYADPVYADVGLYDTGALWLAAVAFMIQVYCDFSGYSDMAIGTANLLGYRLTRNFDMPLAARNISDFWRRWHISLSSWVRDYVYFPLGGSRMGGWATCRNLVITMTLVGFWHGAAWRFVLFGFLHGLFISLHVLWRQCCHERPLWQRTVDSAAGRIAGNILTIFLFCTTLVIFRAPSISDGLRMLWHMGIPTDGYGVPVNERSFWMTLLVLIVAHTIGHHRTFFERWADRIPSPIRGFGYASVLCTALVLSPEIDQAFIYFQF